MRRWVLAAALGLLAIAPGRASASFTFVFNQTGFAGSSPGVLAGSFTTDDSITSLLDYDITTSAGGDFPGFTYTRANSVATEVLSPYSFSLSTVGGDRRLEISFYGFLTSEGARLSLGTRESATGRETRYLISGGVIPLTVPEPSSALLLGMGLAGAGLALRVLSPRSAADRPRRSSRLRSRDRTSGVM